MGTIRREKSKGIKPRVRAVRPGVERMEARALLATLVVTGVGDAIAVDGVVTLREAITAANTNAASGDATAGDAGLDAIGFNIPGAGVQTIAPASALPAITDPVVIDGYTQPGASANTLAVGSDAVLLIELDGTALGTSNGLVLQGGGGTVRGLVVNRFGTGVLLASDDNVVAGNFIGLDPSGVADLGNLGIGVSVASGANNLIGGEAASARNVISGNPTNVQIARTGGSITPTATIVRGNYIGTNAAGTGVVDTFFGAVGILAQAPGITIGGTTAGARNVISGNNEGIFYNGISSNPGVDGTLTIQGNYIGVDATGNAALGNRRTGIFIVSGDTVIIGGSVAGAGNVISGNAGGGIQSGGFETTIQGNLVGTNAAGTAAIGNGFVGIQVSNGGTPGTPRNVLIGGTTAAARNVVAGNGGIAGSGGILLSGVDEGTKLVQGNFIGTLADGITPAGNAGFGVRSGVRATIGGSGLGSANVIANNTSAGVIVSDDPVVAVGVSILGNAIYGNTLGGIALGNGLNGSPDSPPANDLGDADGGANNLQNFPIVTSAVLSGVGATVGATLNSRPSTVYTIQFYSNAPLGPAAPIQGGTFLGSTTTTTDAAGNATFSAVVSAPPAGQTVVTATATDPGGNTSIFSINPAILAPPTATNADLSVTIAGTPDPVAAGSTITYTITVANAGPDAAQDASLATSVPSGTTFVSLALPQGWTATAPAPGGIGAIAATLASGAAAPGSASVFTLLVRVDVGAVGSITANASATSSSPDATPANNSATATTTITAAPQLPADLAVAATDAPDPVAAGGNLAYTIVVTNKLSGAAQGVTLEAAVPAGTTFVSFTAPAGWSARTPAAGETGTIDATDASLEPGPATFTLVVRVGPGTAAGSILNFSARVVALRGGDPTPADNSATATTTVAATPTTNSAPTVAADAYSATAGQALIIPARGILSNDSDPEGNPLSVVVETGPTRGTLALRPDGSFTYTPSAGFAGIDSFTYRASDGLLTSAPATVTLTVAAAPVPPPGSDLVGPRVTGLQRFGFHAQATHLVVTFDEALAQAGTADLANYRLVAAGRDGRIGTRDDVSIALRSATLDPGSGSVRIITRSPLPLRHRYRLTVGGLTDRAGNQLDGDGDGRPGGAAALSFNRSILAGRSDFAAQARRLAKAPALKGRAASR